MTIDPSDVFTRAEPFTVRLSTVDATTGIAGHHADEQLRAISL